MTTKLASMVLAAGLSVTGATSVLSQELIYGNFLPPKHGINVDGLEPMFEDLAGTIDWRLVPGGQLFSGASSLKSIGGRVADAGLVVTSFSRSELKHNYLIADLFMLGKDAMAMNAAAMETIMLDCPECNDDYTKAQTVFLAGYAFDGFSLLCRDPDVASVADVAGKKVKISGAQGRWAKALDAVPISMSSGDIPEALQRGQIDCAMGPVAWLLAYPIEDTVKSIYLYDYGALGALGAFIMNKQVWDGLSDDQRQAMWDALPSYSARVVVDSYKGDTLRALARADELGIAVTQGSDDIATIWNEHIKNEMVTVVEEGAALRIEDSKSIVDTFVANLEKWETIIAESGLLDSLAEADSENLGPIAESYAALLQEHIYSQIDPNAY